MEQYLRSLPMDGPSVLSYRPPAPGAHPHVGDGAPGLLGCMGGASPARRGPVTGALSGLRALYKELSGKTLRLRRHTWTSWVQNQNHLQDLTAEDLRLALVKQSSRCAAGMDG